MKRTLRAHELVLVTSMCAALGVLSSLTEAGIHTHGNVRAMYFPRSTAELRQLEEEIQALIRHARMRDATMNFLAGWAVSAPLVIAGRLLKQRSGHIPREELVWLGQGILWLPLFLAFGMQRSCVRSFEAILSIGQLTVGVLSVWFLWVNPRPTEGKDVLLMCAGTSFVFVLYILFFYPYWP